MLLAVVPLLRRLSSRALLVGAAIAFLVPAVVAAGFDGHRLRAGTQPTSYRELLDVPELVRVVLWTGGYPLVGWVGFVLVGLWVARQRLGDRSVQLRLLLVGAGVALLQPVLAWIHTGIGGASTPTTAGGIAAFFDGEAHSNRTAWYVLGTATALAVVGAALLVTSHPAGRWRRPPVCLGQLALSAYVAHLLLGRQLVWAWNDRSAPSVAVQMAVLAVVVIGFAVLATIWRSRYRRGPLEGLLRAVSG